MTTRSRHRTTDSPTRRGVLAGGAGVAALALGGLPLAARPARTDERTLVVLQLTGGNDGLNTVIPFAQDRYFRLRPTLAQARGAVHRLDDAVALHPAMGGLAELFAEGRLAVVQGLGSPTPERSHFRSLEIWHTARPDAEPGEVEVGWLGRLADQLLAHRPDALPALSIGGGNLLLSMRAERSNTPTIHDPGGLRLHPRLAELAPWRDRVLAGTDGDDTLAFLRRAAHTSYDAAARMEALAERDATVDYPGGDLARGLRLTASLIEGDFGTRVFHLERGGFDTHARQAPVHTALLGDVSSALTAFQRDIEERGVADRVVTLVFSEFGRRAQENGSHGTDHGFGAPAFVLGAPAAGGLHGDAPDLDVLVDGDVPATLDFRRVYATLEREWLGLTPSSRAKPLPLLAT